MDPRLSTARVRADYSALRNLEAVGRLHGVTGGCIKRRVKDLMPARTVTGASASRAALLHKAGMTLDQIERATGISLQDAVEAIRVAHASAQTGR